MKKSNLQLREENHYLRTKLAALEAALTQIQQDLDKAPELVMFDKNKLQRTISKGLDWEPLA